MKLRFVYLLTFFVILSISLILANKVFANSSDAIAIRIVPNPDNFSVLTWYNNNGFVGSPQSLMIDGYEAIRNGNSVYLNTANIKDNSLYTNIVIVSNTLDSDNSTTDIFGQVIKNLKFNTNILDKGTCRLSGDSCLYNSDCAVNDYCNSQKAKVIRDVKRLEHLQEIKNKLENYKKNNGFYPKLENGSYISGFSLSVWPSWRQKLVSDIGFDLPIDPINKLGKCSGFDELTCWDEKNHVFAKDLSSYLLPSGSYVYLFASWNQGRSIKYCAQMESGYSNIIELSCSNGSQVNGAPTIKSVNLSAVSGHEFSGYVVASDPDDDNLNLKIDLVSPASDVWLSNNWKWNPGFDKFLISKTGITNQFKVSAPISGNYHFDPQYYKVKLTVDDGMGAANSTYANQYPVTLSKMPPVFDNKIKSTVIGNDDVVNMSGLNSEGSPVDKIFFKGASFNGQAISETELLNKGFSFSGAKIIETYKTTQMVGTYVIDVYFLNGTSQVSANLTYNLTNNAPKLSSLTARFSNNSTQDCLPGAACEIAIDNGEAAKINVLAYDEDNHPIRYALINSDSNLVINEITGVISGLEKLNYQSATAKTFTVSVKMSDSYCHNSSAEQCSSVYNFNLKVMGYCSPDNPSSMLKELIPGPITINKSGDILNTGFNKSCSVIASSTANINFIGGNDMVNRNQAIVVVSDISGSMNTNVTIDNVAKPAIERLKETLFKTGGFIDQLAQTAVSRAPDYFLKMNMVLFNDIAWVRSSLFSDLSIAYHVEYLKNLTTFYSASGTTNTFAALNKAKDLLNSITDENTEKNIILLSDGLPLVYKPESICSCVSMSCNCYKDKYPDCHNYPYSDCTILDNAACTKADLCWRDQCGVCYAKYCPCGGIYPDCVECQSGPPAGAYNNLLNFVKFFSRLFRVEAVRAAEETVCKITDPCLNSNLVCSEPYTYRSRILTSYTYDCDQTPDVSLLAHEIKNAGINIYTVYYKTSSSNDPKQLMCNWSSNNGKNCDNNNYAFSGTNIDEMINKVKNNLIMYKPRNVLVGGGAVSDINPAEINTVVTSAISGLSCSNPNPVVTFNDKGSLIFSNIEINYCAAKLHP